MQVWLLWQIHADMFLFSNSCLCAINSKGASVRLLNFTRYKPRLLTSRSQGYLQFSLVTSLPAAGGINQSWSLKELEKLRAEEQEGFWPCTMFSFLWISFFRSFSTQVVPLSPQLQDHYSNFCTSTLRRPNLHPALESWAQEGPVGTSPDEHEGDWRDGGALLWGKAERELGL